MSIYIKGNVNGDVIEAGGVKKETHFHYSGEQTAQQPNEHQEGGEGEELTFFVHPAVEATEGRKIHNEIKRLVNTQGIKDICAYLNGMNNEKRILLPQEATRAYKELVRLGMPSGEGYNEKTFMKYYKK